MLWLVHTALDRDWDREQETMGFHITLCTVHTTQGQGIIVFSIVPIPIPVPVLFPVPCSVYEPLDSWKGSEARGSLHGEGGARAGGPCLVRAGEGQFWQSAHVGSGHMGTLCTDRMTDRQTGLKTLPSRNFVARR